MGTSTSFEQLAGKLNRVSSNLTSTTQKATGSACKAAKDVFLVSVSGATGGDAKLSQVGKNGARLGVNYRVVGKGDDVQGRVRATGPWHLVEYAINAHLITSKRAGGSRRSRARRFEEGATGEGIGGGRSAMLRTPYGPRPYVIHPGTRNPKKPWQRAVPVVTKIVPIAYQKAINELMVGVFR